MRGEKELGKRRRDGRGERVREDSGGMKTRVESSEEKSSYPKVSAPESNLSPILGA